MFNLHIKFCTAFMKTVSTVFNLNVLLCILLLAKIKKQVVSLEGNEKLSN